MTDFIKSSLRINDALKAQKITIEVDEFAPIVLDNGEKEPHYVVDVCADWKHQMVCPYFGPGGEGNLLKALRAFWRKGGELIIKGPPYSAMMDFAEGGRLCFGGKRSETTDGKVLHDLLYELTVKKGEQS